MEDKREREIKKPGFFLAVLPLIFMFVVLIVGLLIFSCLLYTSDAADEL